MSDAVTQSPFRFNSFNGSGLAIARKHHHHQSGPQEDDGDAQVTFTHLSFTFPLKLISPRAASRNAIARIAKEYQRNKFQEQQNTNSTSKDADTISASHHNHNHKPVAALYIIGYGGGLVSGDQVTLGIDVGQGCTMLVLTQGSTKVYKMRGAGDSSSEEQKEARTTTTSQTIQSIVRSKATLIILPDPVTCYARARYVQTQQFDLHDRQTSSLVLLDWFTPGRVYQVTREGKRTTERWAFSRYTSRNEVRVQGLGVVARDILSLEQSDDEAVRTMSTTEEKGDVKSAKYKGPIAQKCEPYTCFATLILYGNDTFAVVSQLKREFYAIQQHQKRPSSTSKTGQQSSAFSKNKDSSTEEDGVLWSCSSLTVAGEGDEADTGGLIVRVAGLSTELVRHWLRVHLSALTMLVGDDLYRQALG